MALEHLLASRSEQLALEQRDLAIATKAEIGNRREATAMATASAAVRKVKHLENELGRGCQHATVTVEKAAHRSFGSQGFRPLKNWCDSHGVSAPKVQDPRFGWVRSGLLPPGRLFTKLTWPNCSAPQETTNESQAYPCATRP